MSRRQAKGLLGGSLILVLASLTTVGWISLSQARSTEPYRITIIAKGMSFVLADQPEVANPLLRLPAGREVEILFRNEDTGARHNLVIEELGFATPILEAGESAVLRFTTPQRDACTYYCELHPVLMRGEIQPVPSGAEMADATAADPRQPTNHPLPLGE